MAARKDHRGHHRVSVTTASVLLALAVLPGCSPERIESTDVLSILATPDKAEVDTLPDFHKETSGGDGAKILVIRFVGETTTGKYWVGADEYDNICTFLYLKGSQGLGGSCTPLYRFRLNGSADGSSGSYEDDDGNFQSDHSEMCVVPDGYSPLHVPEGL